MCARVLYLLERVPLSDLPGFLQISEDLSRFPKLKYLGTFHGAPEKSQSEGSLLASLACKQRAFPCVPVLHLCNVKSCRLRCR